VKIDAAEKVIEKAARIDRRMLRKYEPFIDEMRHDSLLAMLGTPLMNLRRLVLLLMAMFVVNKQWLQLWVFIHLNLLSLVYVVVVKPRQPSILNYSDTFNEVIGLVVAYFILVLQDER